MRVELKGTGGSIPTVALPHDVEVGALPTQAFLLQNDVPFLKAPYVEQGYTHFEVWCVGAAGGKGGNDSSYGGEGGGGGLHRVQGRLVDLPDSCAVIVGVVGADGRPASGHYATQPEYVPPLSGNNGGFSSFGGVICRASGGKGGLKSPWPKLPSGRPDYWTNFAPGGEGGDGGLGGQSTAGGGGTGGKTEYIPQGQPGSSYPYRYEHTQATGGQWDDESIGGGGGGGRGGNPQANADYGSTTHHEAGSGEKGSYSFVDTSVWGPGVPRKSVFVSGGQYGPSYTAWPIPGGGGGARINTLLPYGSKVEGYNPNGAVWIRLSRLVPLPIGIFLENGVPFLKAPYIYQGFTNFEVWVVGAVGGKGGDVPFGWASGSGDATYIGGGGGGGGLHKAEGLLSELPDSCPVVIGVAGANGTNEGQSSPAATIGEDGGASSFNGDMCQASGGKGGTPPEEHAYQIPNNSGTYYKWDSGDGGQGGSGGRILSGGGGDGATASTLFGNPTTPTVPTGSAFTEAEDGGWDGVVGQGGGGGRGGGITQTQQTPPTGPIIVTPREASISGKGSYSPVDTSVNGAAQARSNYLNTTWSIVPGSGGGARIEGQYGYGSKAYNFNPNGAVFIRLFHID